MFDYYTIEIETTNFCNAKCVFCANKDIKRSRGFIDVNKLKTFLQYQSQLLKDNIFRQNSPKYPRVTFCGLGDPLMHPKISLLVSVAHNLGFYTQLVTNGRLLTPKLSNELIKAGLDEIAISLHSMNPVNYWNIVGIPLEETLKSLENSLKILSKRISVQFWRIKHPDNKFHDKVVDEKKFEEFLKKVGVSKNNMLGPSNAWSRDEYVKDSVCSKVDDHFLWCNKIYFTFNIDWQGNAILCCNDYNKETIPLGNVFSKDFDYDKYFKEKRKILNKQIIPEICKKCRRWPDNEIEDILKEANIKAGVLKKRVHKDLRITNSTSKIKKQ